MTETHASRIDFNVLVSNVLRYGVLLSTALIITGVLLVFAKNTTLILPDSIKQLISTNFGKPVLNVGLLLQNVAELNPLSIIEVGILILLATPTARVAISVFYFATETDGTYVLITLFVLLVLLFSAFVLGPTEAASG